MGAAHEGKHPLIGLGKNDERNFALIYLKKRKKYSLVSDVNQSNTLFTTRYNNKVPVFFFCFFFINPSSQVVFILFSHSPDLLLCDDKQPKGSGYLENKIKQAKICPWIFLADSYFLLISIGLFLVFQLPSKRLLHAGTHGLLLFFL